jgi:hypothetical protein
MARTVTVMSTVELSVKPGQVPTTSIVIVAKGPSLESLTTIDVRNRVLAFARVNGLPSASGLDRVPPAYPVDETGECSEDVLFGRKKLDHFEAEYTVNVGL